MAPFTTVEMSNELNPGANRCVWTPGSPYQLKLVSEEDAMGAVKEIKEKPKYKTTRINNRRFLGNKYKLLPFIVDVVEKNCPGINSVADIFSGTGAVASAFLDKKLILNDNMYSNYICNVAWFGTEKVNKEKIIALIQSYNEQKHFEDNYMSENFADTYFSKNVCQKIGHIREDIEQLFLKKEINGRERAVLITSLLYAMDKIANTCGHYDAYRKKGEFDDNLELAVPLISNDLNENNRCYNLDANELVKDIAADLVYVDPPYNSRQYCDIYHLLENVAKWEKPEVFGVAKKMDRRHLKSRYCTQKATEALEDLVKNIKSKYVLLSYNNMATKGDDRSNAKISDADIIRILSQKGTVSVFTKDYRTFTTGKSNIVGNEERLFLCKCKESFSQ